MGLERLRERHPEKFVLVLGIADSSCVDGCKEMMNSLGVHSDMMELVYNRWVGTAHCLTSWHMADSRLFVQNYLMVPPVAVHLGVRLHHCRVEID